MATDFKKLCAELLNEFEYYTDWSDAELLKAKARAALAEPEPERPTLRQLMLLADDMDMASVGDAAEYARAVLARWGNPEPAPQAKGEVAEFARLLEAGGTCPTGVKLTRDHCRRVAALLHRLQELAPAPPANGEVAELVSWLKKFSCVDWIADEKAERITRAAELLQRQALVPVSVSERLPGPEDCDAEGRCWWWYPPVPEQTYGYWAHEDDAIPERAIDEQPTHWLPAQALPIPQQPETIND